METATLNQSRDFVLKKNLSSTMNNTKWFDLFEEIEFEKLTIELKKLQSETIVKTDFFQEVSETSILFSNDGKFIPYLEIEYLIIHSPAKIVDYLKSKNIEFSELGDSFKILGYY